jgi:hypothetical protein
MKKNYIKKSILLILLASANITFAQDANKYNEISGNLQLKKLSTTQTLSNSLISRSSTSTLASTITPASQTICSGSAITSITASGPLISDALSLDCMTGGGASLINIANNGIYFDISNTGAVPLRVTGFDFATYAATATAAITNQGFTFYKTTAATTAVGNYNTAANWTNLGTLTWALPITAANSGYILTADLGDTGFTLAAGASVGFYIVCNNTSATTGFRMGYRTLATTGVPIANSDITVTHRSRGDGLFTGGTTLRGFYGNVLYHTGTYGYWGRNNTTNITGVTTAGDAFSGATPFPISGSLTNATATQQTTTYTIISYDVNGVKATQTATITVDPSTITTVTNAAGTLTANQAGATYQWFDCNNGNTIIPGEINQSYTPAITGDYGVTITAGSCPAVNSSCNNVLGTKSFELTNDFELYPNPSYGSFTIKSKYDIRFSIVNQLGQVVRKFETGTDTEQKITTNDLATGMYLLLGVTADGKKMNKKIIIN